MENEGIISISLCWHHLSKNIQEMFPELLLCARHRMEHERCREWNRALSPMEDVSWKKDASTVGVQSFGNTWTNLTHSRSAEDFSGGDTKPS